MFRVKPTGRFEEPGDVLIRIDVRHDPMAGLGQQPQRRDLGCRVESGQVAGEAADHAQLGRPPHGGCVQRPLGPGKSVGDRQVLGA